MFSHLRELGINALVLSRTGLLAVWVAETWNKLFQRQEFWCREAAQSALRQWWACPGRIIHSSTKKLPPPQKHAFFWCLSPLPQSTLLPGFFLSMHVSVWKSKSLISVLWPDTVRFSPALLFSFQDDSLYSGRLFWMGLGSCGWCHNSSCWICKLPLYSTDPLSLSS